MRETVDTAISAPRKVPWNKGKLTGAKPPLLKWTPGAGPRIA